MLAPLRTFDNEVPRAQVQNGIRQPTVFATKDTAKRHKTLTKLNKGLGLEQSKGQSVAA